MKIDLNNRAHCNRLVDLFAFVVSVALVVWAHV